MLNRGFDLDVYKDVPGYKGILKAVLKSQIQILVEQLRAHAGEESVILTASVSEGTLSHLGSESGQDFLFSHDEIKSQFLGFCLKSKCINCRVLRRKECKRWGCQKRKPEDHSKRFAGSFDLDRESQGMGKRILSSEVPVKPTAITRMTPESMMSFPAHKKRAYHVQGQDHLLCSSSGKKQFELTPDNVISSLDALTSIKASHATSRPISDEGDLAGSGDMGRSLAHSTACSGNNESHDKTPLHKTYMNDPNSVLDLGKKCVKPSMYNDNHNDRVLVKVEADDDGDIKTEIAEREPGDSADEMQMLKSRLSPKPYRRKNSIEPNGESMETGKQPYDYVSRSSKISNASPSPISWRQEEFTAKSANGTSKRKQTVPTKLTKGSDGMMLSQNHNLDALPNLTSADREDSDYAYGLDPKAHYQLVDDNGGIAVKKEPVETPEYDTASDKNLYNNAGGYLETDANSSYDEYREPSWSYTYVDRSELSPQSKQYRPLEMEVSNKPKVRPIDGLLVSRGEGRYEKLIKCEICHKVCRTSNMARHKKKYCLASSRMSRMSSLMKDDHSEHMSAIKDNLSEHSFSAGDSNLEPSGFSGGSYHLTD